MWKNQTDRVKIISFQENLGTDFGIDSMSANRNWTTGSLVNRANLLLQRCVKKEYQSTGENNVKMDVSFGFNNSRCYMRGYFGNSHLCRCTRT